MDNAALTVLVDRWRSETHTFHLPFGEMTITLEDIAMVFGLRVDGRVMTRSIEPVGWRDRVHLLLGVRPEDPPENVKDSKTTEGVLARYAHAWLWHMVSGFTISWMWLPIIHQDFTISWMWLPRIGQDWDNIGTYSWGIATIAWLYRQLCDDLPYHDDESLATVRYLWSIISTIHGNPRWCYIEYINAIDYLRSSHVMQQFGILQTCPPEYNNTGQDLHLIDRRKQRGAKNWEKKHMHAINAWNLRANNKVYGGAVHRDGPFNQYLDWLKQNTCLKLKVAMDTTNIEDLPSDPKDIFPKYDEVTRSGQQLGRFANEAGQALSIPIRSPEEASVLRGFLQRLRWGYRKIAFKMNCLLAPAPPIDKVSFSIEALSILKHG
uniref:Aminotransferase-like plant mobile domain-containing protein n=1 Tax=Setaria italica TaxID=4555 RepID=K3ZMP9_SETIT